MEIKKYGATEKRGCFDNQADCFHRCSYRGEITDFVLNNTDNIGDEYIILDSPGIGQNNRYSYLMTGIKKKIILKNGRLTIDGVDYKEEITDAQEIFEILRKLHGKAGYSDDFFKSGIFSVLSYDFKNYTEELNNEADDDTGIPDGYFVVPSTVIIIDKIEQAMSFWGINDKNWSTEIETSFCIDTGLTEPYTDSLSKYKSNITKERFLEIVERAKEYILAGDIFQANLSQRFEREFDERDSLILYLILRKVNPSPFAAFVKTKEFTIVSQSPERLVSLQGRTAETRPIAGTRRKKKDNMNEMESELLLNEKEKAEHIMLVDLERNDLGRVCSYGTVHVDELMTIEKYSHVMHIVSNVKGILRDGSDAYDLLQAMFPGGTITGAPKIRSMEIIEELEPTKRGFYTGSLGYVDDSGNADFNIIIRTIVIKNKKLYFQVGAGVVYDSVPEAEYKETINKARAMLLALDIYDEYKRRILKNDTND